MKIRGIILLSVSFFVMALSAQESDLTLLPYSAIISKKSEISRLIEIALPELVGGMVGGYQSYTNYIKVIEISGITVFYYQISGKNKGGYDFHYGLVQESELPEVIEAIDSLISNHSMDESIPPGAYERLESRYITKDGCVIGYYITSQLSSWYISTDSTRYFDNVEEIIYGFIQARDTIAELKQQME